MIRLTRRALLAAALLTAAATGTPFAQTPTASLSIEAPWARASAGQASNSAAYMVIINKTNTVDRLVGAAGSVADKVELHTHLNENGVMSMRPVQGVDINPGEPAIFQPGGLHIMLIGLKAPLKAGDKFPLSLTFEKAGKIDVVVEVKSPGATAPSGHQHNKH